MAVVYVCFYRRKTCISDDGVSNFWRYSYPGDRQPNFLNIFDRKIHLTIKHTRKINYSEVLCYGKLLLIYAGEDYLARHIRAEVTVKSGEWHQAAVLTVSDFLFLLFVCLYQTLKTFVLNSQLFSMH